MQPVNSVAHLLRHAPDIRADHRPLVAQAFLDHHRRILPPDRRHHHGVDPLHEAIDLGVVVCAVEPYVAPRVLHPRDEIGSELGGLVGVVAMDVELHLAVAVVIEQFGGVEQYPDAFEQ